MPRKSLQKAPIKAVAYLRTSSATNVGGDSELRQREAIVRFAESAGYEIAEGDWFYDAAVSGADTIEDRPGFAAILDRIDGNGVRTIIVEDASRFARDMRAHVLGIALLRQRGVTLMTTSGQNLTDDTDEMQEAMVSIAAAFATLEKKRLVRKLRAARDRKREKTGRCEGRLPLSATHPEVVTRAQQLYRANSKTGLRRSLRDIAQVLASEGHVTARGTPLNPKTVRSMVSSR